MKILNVAQRLYSLWQYKVYADIRGGSMGRIVINQHGVVDISTTLIFSIFADCIFGNFRDKSNLDTQSLVYMLSTDPKIYDLEWLCMTIITLNSVFAPVRHTSQKQLRENKSLVKFL